MLLDEQPTHMREEESAGSVVRVRVRLRVLVVHAVVAGPVPDAALVRDRVAEHQEGAQRETSLVRTMRPQTMRTAGDATHTTTLIFNILEYK